MRESEKGHLSGLRESEKGHLLGSRLSEKGLQLELKKSDSEHQIRQGLLSLETFESRLIVNLQILRM